MPIAHRFLARWLLPAVVIAASVVPRVASLQAQGKPATVKPASVIRRVPADSLWRRVWSLGGDSTSDTFVEPRHIVATGDLVVVLDAGTREVHALDARTGATRFVLKPKGEGPGEFRRPAKLAATPSGFGVLDHATARFSAFDRTGKWQWSAALSDVFTTSGICVRAGNRIVTTLTRHDSSIVEFDSTGKRLAVRSIPWVELVRGGVGFAYEHVTSIASRDGTCVEAPLFGSEFAVIPPSGAPRAFRVLEPGPQPVVVVTQRVLERSLTRSVIQSNQQSDTKQASHGALIIGDTAIINASTTSTFDSRWLDYYNATTGKYLLSRHLPFFANAITAGDDGTIYLTSIGQTVSAIIALRPATLDEAMRATKGIKPKR